MIDPLGKGTADARDVRVVARGGAVQIAGQFTQGVVAFVFVAFAVRTLGADDYGLFRQVAQILAVAGQVGLAGFNYAALRFIAQARAAGDPAAVRDVASTAVGGALVASAVVFVSLQLGAGEIAARFAEDDASQAELVGLIRLGGVFVPLFAATQVLRYCTQAYKTMVPSVVVGNIVQPVVRLLAAATLILAGAGVRGAVVGMVVASGAAFVLAVVLFRRMMTRPEREGRARSSRRAMMRFALLQGGSSLLGIQTLGLGVLILGAFGTDRDVGLLGIALAVQTPGTIFLGGIVNIWAPVVTDLYERGEMARLEALYRTITRWVVTFSLPVFVGLIVLPELFVNLVAGDRGDGAAGLVAVLAVGNIFYAATGPTGFVLSMTGRPGINFANSLVGVSIFIGLGVWIVPKHGALGMAAVDASVTALINVVRVVEARIVVGIHPFGRSLVKPAAATATALVVVVALLRLTGSESTAVALSILALGGLTYFLVLKRLGVDPEERQVLDGMRRAARVISGKARP